MGTTRPMKKLYLTYSKFRRRFGSELIPMITSRFISELPNDNIKHIGSKGLEFNSKKIIKDLDYSKGQIVEHSLFGKGKIIDVEGSGGESKLTVIFHGNVQKKLIAKYANLKIVYN